MIVVHPDRIEMRRPCTPGRIQTTPLAVDGTGRKASALQGLAHSTELPGLLRTGVVA